MHRENNTYVQPPAPPSQPEKKDSPFGTIKAIGCTILAIIAIICIINPSFKEELVGALFNKALELDGTAYIKMVKDVEFYDGITYRDLLDGNEYFESKEWKFYKSDGNKYVKFNGIANGDILQIQFSLECVNEKEGTYYITPENISLNGVSVKDIFSLISLFA